MKTELEKIEAKKEAFQNDGGVLCIDSLTGQEINPMFEAIDRGLNVGRILPSRESVLVSELMAGNMEYRKG